MKIGDTVVVERCEECPSVVGKNAVVKTFSEDGNSVTLSFGKGRPQKGRPQWFSVDSLIVRS